MYSEHYIESFWKQVEKTDKCWLWKGRSDANGYGLFRYYDNIKSAHRLSLELHLGRPIIKGLIVAHKPVECHNRLCINPAHLREATYKENADDRLLDGTQGYGQFASRHGKLTDEQVKAIRIDTRINELIGIEYKISNHHVGAIKNRRVYKWVE